MTPRGNASLAVLRLVARKPLRSVERASCDGCGSALLLLLDLLVLRGVARHANLFRVLVRVAGVDLEPAFDAVAPDFAVRPFAQPFGLGEPVEDLGGRPPRGVEGVERSLH